MFGVWVKSAHVLVFVKTFMSRERHSYISYIYKQILCRINQVMCKRLCGICHLTHSHCIIHTTIMLCFHYKTLNGSSRCRVLVSPWVQGPAVRTSFLVLKVPLLVSTAMTSPGWIPVTLWCWRRTPPRSQKSLCRLTVIHIMEHINLHKRQV